MKADARAIYSRLRAGGMAHHHACGIIGNLMQESGLKTDVLGFDGTGSIGLAQWLGPRKRALIEYARRTKRVETDWTAQVDFILLELKSSEIAAARKLLATKTIEEAALAFSKYYERPHKNYAHNDKRVRYAETFSRGLIK